jgi:hypothetical protein
MRALRFFIVLAMSLTVSDTVRAQEPGAPAQLPNPPYQSVGTGEGLAVQVFTPVKVQGKFRIAVPLLCGTILHDQFNPQLPRPINSTFPPPPVPNLVPAPFVPGTYLSAASVHPLGVPGSLVETRGPASCAQIPGFTPKLGFTVGVLEASSSSEFIVVAFYSSKNVVTVIEQGWLGMAPTQ